MPVSLRLAERGISVRTMGTSIDVTGHAAQTTDPLPDLYGL